VRDLHPLPFSLAPKKDEHLGDFQASMFGYFGQSFFRETRLAIAIRFRPYLETSGAQEGFKREVRCETGAVPPL
jgi:hypothetical protein